MPAIPKGHVKTVIEAMEPAARDAFLAHDGDLGDAMEHAGVVSLAVSFRRVADALERLTLPTK